MTVNRTIVVVGLGAVAVAASGFAISTASANTEPQASTCQPEGDAQSSLGFPAGTTAVAMSVQVKGEPRRVVMGAYWTSDHWSDRVAYVAGPSGERKPITARDLDSVGQSTRDAYRAVFACVQDAATQAAPA